MWPFKNKEKKLNYYSLFNIDFTLLGIQHGIELRKQIGRPPKYTPSKIIQDYFKSQFK
jgi:hypothetical protein